MSKVTELATGQITATETITVELIEANETPAVVIIRWPARPSVLHPRRFPDAAAVLARLFATAATELAPSRTAIGTCERDATGPGTNRCGNPSQPVKTRRFDIHPGTFQSGPKSSRRSRYIRPTTPGLYLCAVRVPD